MLDNDSNSAGRAARGRIASLFGRALSLGALCLLTAWAASAQAPAPDINRTADASGTADIDTAPAAGSCERLAQLASERLLISRVQQVPAGPLPSARAAPAGAPVQLPEHCLIDGALEPRVGAGGVHYQIGFEMRLPMQWNGRFLYQGGGGLDGVVQPAIGNVGLRATPALVRGYAVVSTDSGHQGADARFGFDQQARLDYAYAAIGKVSATAKDIISQFYGRRPRYSYFVGCSNGGREAMMAAQRFPYDFDGIVAGDPGFRLSSAIVGEFWAVQQLDKIAPADAQGRPILSRALTEAELKLISQAVLRQCDSLDGLADGMINDVLGCHFDLRSLQCKAGGKASGQHDCLSAAKVAALRTALAGAHDERGQSLSPDWPYDAGMSAAGWRLWQLGTSPTGVPNALNATLGLIAMQDYFLTPPDPDLTVQKFDFDRDPSRIAQTAALNDATATFLTSFVGHHGRMLIYQGMSDPVFSAKDIIRWYRSLADEAGSTAAGADGTNAVAVQDWARLFLVPGMNHCGGGPATDHFDVLAAIQAWTERGAAPDRIIASGASLPGVTRPLCPFPKYARYVGGDPKAAASFECR